MGTETDIHKQINLNSLISVKLNDPLMGTETYCTVQNYKTYNFLHVKLNDPLMGTETLRHRITEWFS